VIDAEMNVRRGSAVLPLRLSSLENVEELEVFMVYAFKLE